MSNINGLINSLIKDNDVDLVDEETALHYFKENTIEIKGNSSYEDASLVDCLPKGKEFIVICDEESSNESGDYSWCFQIMLKHNGLYYVLTDRG